MMGCNAAMLPLRFSTFQSVNSWEPELNFNRMDSPPMSCTDMHSMSKHQCIMQSPAIRLQMSCPFLQWNPSHIFFLHDSVQRYVLTRKDQDPILVFWL